MDEKDPPPFGYTFNTDPFENHSHTFDNAGPSLLSDMENQSLVDFFSNTDPFLNDGSSAFAPPPNKNDGTDDFANWNLGFVPPATIHQVSTTIPDQSQFNHGFHPDHTFTQQPMSSSHMNNTQDDLQAASTLFSNAHTPHNNGRSYSFPNLPTRHTPATTYDDGNHPKPMVITAHGLINEQLAALLPNHGEDGSIDAQLATQWASSNAAQRHEEEFGEILGRTPVKRTFSFGTDSAFNSTGYMAPSNQESEEHVTQRLIREMVRAQPLLRAASNADGTSAQSPTGHVHFPPLSGVTSDDDGQSEETSDEADGADGPAKKRRKSKHSVSLKGANGSPRKSLSAGRPGKARKASVDDQALKKKRPSAASQKVHRENLTEEQKRNNHILSEQKRRNLIKRGFDDLHDLVPEIRNGGLSKSSVLMEAANFLEKLIQDNNQFFRLVGVEG